MEPEVKEFFKRVMYSVFAGLLWLGLNTTFGIMYGFAFPENNISIGNIIFYVWFVASIILLLRFYIKLWKKSFEENKDL